MRIEKQGSKGGNYVGGFLQMFDWNVKARKKLFSSSPEVPEQSKQQKRCDGTLPTTRLAMMDVNENVAGSSVRGSSDHSCASSFVDEDFCGTKAPGVVARLMGLDSLPKSAISEAYSTPLFSSCSLRDAYYQTNRETELNYPRVMQKPIEKFQKEILPPKSAKSIPITHHKLLSPIKRTNFIQSKDAAHIMEAASRIIEAGPPHESTKAKLPSVGSSSAPLRVRDLKEKAEATQKQKSSKIFEGSQRKAESSTVKSLRGNSMNKSWNGSVDAMPKRVVQDSDASSPSNGVKSKGKSISLALQAKANVQKRGLTVNRVSQKESCELSPNHPLKSQSNTQKSSTVKKASTHNGASVLRQNNQKQNCIVDGGRLSSKGGKLLSGESSSTRQRNPSKVSSTSRVNTRKLSSEVRDDRLQALSSGKERVTSKKRSVDGTYHLGKNQTSQSSLQLRDIAERQSRLDHDNGGTGTDVVSFTFTAPMTRAGSDSVRPREDGETHKILSVSYKSERSLMSSNGTSASRFSSNVHNVKGGDALSTLLEQKLKELADKVEFSQHTSRTDSNDMVPCLEASMSSSMPESCKARGGMHKVDTVEIEETGTSNGSISQARKLLDSKLPSPISVLENPSSAESCSSSNSAESNSSGGSKQCSSNQTLEALDSYSLKTYLTVEPDAELSDSASSTVAKRKGTILTISNNANPKRWDFEYVKEILSDMELMFEDYAVGRSQGIVNPHLFYQLESNGEDCSTLDHRIMFDCVGECLDLRCKQYVGGGYRSFAKGISLVRRKDILAQEVYREISSWNTNIGDSMIDELVDKDMSTQYGRWLEFDVELFEIGTQIQSRIVNSLIDEVIADIMML